MNTIEKAKTSTKNFVVKHKTALTVAATTTVCFVVHRVAINQHNDFLKEHGLYEQFYTPENSY